MAQFSAMATGTITGQQAAAVEMAQTHAAELGLASLQPGAEQAGVSVTWDRLPREALTDLVGFTQNGSPLKELLDELGPTASQAVRDGLIQGLALGQNPRTIARQIKGALGGNLVRALRISRTETLRAYRESTRRNYQANSNVVGGWYWTAALDGRTCAACWAMSGTFHTLDERLDDHVNGRCAMVPKTKSWEEMGFSGIEETAPQPRVGVDEFAKLSPERQDGVLGKAGGAAYRAGAVRLRNFVGRRNDPRWGTMRYARSLRSILGAEQAKRWSNPVGLRRVMHIKDWMSDEVQGHLHDIDLLPVSLQERLVTSGLKRIDLGTGTVPSFEGMEYLKGVHPRGWGEMIWDDVPGVYDDSVAEKRVIAGGSAPHGSASLVLHETGHAVGDLLGYNDSEALIGHHKRLFDKLSGYFQQDGPGGIAGREELFAEGVAKVTKYRESALEKFGEEFVKWIEEVLV
jgi:SPP1 gp7 family putative phage head morphogenesis protein